MSLESQLAKAENDLQASKTRYKLGIGAGGEDKFAKLKELKEMFDSGFISKEEMEEMKKEILGK